MTTVSAKTLPYCFAVCPLGSYTTSKGQKRGAGFLVFTSKARTGQSSADVVRGIVKDHGAKVGAAYVILETVAGIGNGPKDGAQAAAILARKGNTYFSPEGKRVACPPALKAIAATWKPATKPATTTTAPTTRKPAPEPVAADAATAPEPAAPILSADAVREAVAAMRAETA